MFNVAQGLHFSGNAEARAVLLSCLMDPCSPDPRRWHFCLSGHQCYFKGKQLACFPAQAGSAKFSPSNHSLGIYFCPPDFPSHFLGLFVWFLLGVMEHDKNREKPQTWVLSPERVWVIECSSLGWFPACPWACLQNVDLLKYSGNCVSNFREKHQG